MKDYIEQAVKTESLNWFEPNRRLLHAAMGLVTETAELKDFADEKNLIEELGDVLWYTALACDTLEITLQEAEETAGGWEVHEFAPITIDDMITSAAEILDVMKKSTFYSQEKFDPVKIADHLGRILLCVAEVGDQLGGVSLDEIMTTNIEKLSKRFKAGQFSQEEALNRDVETEMNHF